MASMSLAARQSVHDHRYRTDYSSRVGQARRSLAYLQREADGHPADSPKRAQLLVQFHVAMHLIKEYATGDPIAERDGVDNIGKATTTTRTHWVRPNAPLATIALIEEGITLGTGALGHQVVARSA